MISDLSASDPRCVGPYRLLGKVGAGGMGIVDLAASPADDVVALKLVRPELADDEEFRRRFKSEVEVVRRVGGVCTAKVRDADVDTDRPWVVTDNSWLARTWRTWWTDTGLSRPTSNVSWLSGWRKPWSPYTMRELCTGISSRKTFCVRPEVRRSSISVLPGPQIPPWSL